jgi:hypothetical protein
MVLSPKNPRVLRGLFAQYHSPDAQSTYLPLGRNRPTLSLQRSGYAVAEFLLGLKRLSTKWAQAIGFAVTFS